MVTTSAVQRAVSRRSLTRAVAHLVTNLAILTGSLLVSAQMRQELPYRGLLPGNYPFLRAEYFLVPLAALILAQLVLAALITQIAINSTAHRQFVSILIALGFSVSMFLIIWPVLSKTQIIYFAAAGVALGVLVILLPARLTAQSGSHTLLVDLTRLWQRRTLLGIWLTYNIRSRYSQAWLGILWIVLLPVSTALVLALVFSEIVRAQVSNVPFAVFVLVALVPWGLFNYGVMNSTRSILGAMPLLNQVYFPREILVLVTVGEGIVDLLFAFVAMLLINAANGIWPNPFFVWLPALLLIQISFTVAIMFFVSCLSVLIRDIPPLVAVVLQLLFYLTPIIYPLEFIPAKYRVLTIINPFAPIVEAFRDVIIRARAPNWTTLYYPIVLSIALLYVGYTFFKAYEHQFADLP